MSIQKIKENIKHHKRKIKKWVLRIFIIGLISIIAYQRYDIIIKQYETKLANEKYNFVMGNISKQVEELTLFNKNLMTQGITGLGNEGIWWRDVANRSNQAYFQNNMTEYQKELQVKEHGKDYKLIYDWLDFPLKDFYIIKSGEFGQPRLFECQWIQHTGGDLVPTSTKEVTSSHDGVVTSRGYDVLGGYYVIITTIKNEYDDKLKKYKDNKYETYYGHLSQIDVEKNQEVKKSLRIGIIGATGKYCYGEHLHFSLRKNGILMNPFLNKTWKGNKLIISIKTNIMCY